MGRTLRPGASDFFEYKVMSIWDCLRDRCGDFWECCNVVERICSICKSRNMFSFSNFTGGG